MRINDVGVIISLVMMLALIDDESGEDARCSFFDYIQNATVFFPRYSISDRKDDGRIRFILSAFSSTNMKRRSPVLVCLKLST